MRFVLNWILRHITSFMEYFEPSPPAHERSERRTDKALRFLYELVVLFPVALIAVGASAFDVPRTKIFVFVTIAYTTISLEICWSCILHAHSLMDRLEELARLANFHRHPERLTVERRVRTLKIQTRFFELMTLATALGWFYVAATEIRFMSSDGGEKPSDLQVYFLGVCSGLNLCLAIGKLWLRSGDYDERLLASFAKSGLEVKGDVPKKSTEKAPEAISETASEESHDEAQQALQEGNRS
jgi:hypothetical protein